MTSHRPREAKTGLCAEDLSVLQRRGQLADAEQRRLQVALMASDTHRCAHELGCSFDDMQTACASDGKLVEGLARRARAHYVGRPRSLGQRILPWLGVACSLLVSAAAGATLWPYASELLGVAPAKRTVVLAPAAVPAKRHGPTRPSPVSTASSAPAEHNVAVPSEPHAARVSGERSRALTPPRRSAEKSVSAAATVLPVPVASDRDTTVRSAAELFKLANAARRRGDMEGARALYRQLREEHPTSNEATLALMVQARVELQQGAAREALIQFDRYLNLAPSGPLAQEALEGRAQAYRQMGMPGEEANAWRELLQRYPDSVYSDAARKRLGALR